LSEFSASLGSDVINLAIFTEVQQLKQKYQHWLPLQSHIRQKVRNHI